MDKTFLNLESPLSQILPGYRISFDLNQISWFRSHLWAKSIFDFRKDFKTFLITFSFFENIQIFLWIQILSRIQISSILNPLFEAKLSLVWISKSFELNPWTKVQILIFGEVQTSVWLSKSIQIYFNSLNSNQNIQKWIQNLSLNSWANLAWLADLAWPFWPGLFPPFEPASLGFQRLRTSQFTPSCRQDVTHWFHLLFTKVHSLQNTFSLHEGAYHTTRQPCLPAWAGQQRAATVSARGAS
jgi:hypothetical protein